jgi:hypothetical protein
MAGLVENAGHPFTPEQRADIASLGEDYEAEYARLQKEYGEDTPKLEKVLDEIELKRITMNAVQDLLTPEQREATGPPQLRDRIGFDLLSPLLMAKMSAQERGVESAEADEGGAAEGGHGDVRPGRRAGGGCGAPLRRLVAGGGARPGTPSPDQTGFGAGLTGSTALSHRAGAAQAHPGAPPAARPERRLAHRAPHRGVWLVPQPPRRRMTSPQSEVFIALLGGQPRVAPDTTAYAMRDSA